MDTFKLKSDYTPTGDQPAAIASLAEGLRSGKKMQTLLDRGKNTQCSIYSEKNSQHK